MYAPYPENMMESIKKVEATRAERMATEPRRLTADEKDALLQKFHPDYNPDAFAEIKVGPNKGQKAPLELAEMLHSTSRLINEKIDLTKIDYDVDLLVIGGGGAGSSCAIEAHNAGADVMQRVISKFLKKSSSELSEDEFMNTLVTIIVLFCASGTGIYGSIVSGMSGDHSVLISKSILDLFTAAIFACSLGMVVCMIAIPQLIIFLILFFAATAIFPLTTPGMINDFKACGGFLMLATGFRMVKLKNFPTADMIPAMVLIMPMSWFWVTYVLPLVS